MDSQPFQLSSPDRQGISAGRQLKSFDLLFDAVVALLVTNYHGDGS
jgi:hypothetical protein